jgi:hypothetical protein
MHKSSGEDFLSCGIDVSAVEEARHPTCQNQKHPTRMSYPRGQRSLFRGSQRITLSQPTCAKLLSSPSQSLFPPNPLTPLQI